MKAEDASAPLKFAWPHDEDGKPMVMVTMGASEKVGLPQYSNVDIGPASITRFVRDDPAEIRKGLEQAVNICEQVIAIERGPIIDLAKQAKA
jgi:hypothetical protein